MKEQRCEDVVETATDRLVQEIYDCKSARGFEEKKARALIEKIIADTKQACRSSVVKMPNSCGTISFACVFEAIDNTKL